MNNNFDETAFKIWNDYKTWSYGKLKEITVFINNLDSEILVLKKRKQYLDTQKLTDIILTKFIEKNLLNLGREIKILYTDIDIILDYLVLRETGSLDNNLLPYSEKLKDIFQNYYRKTTSKDSSVKKSYFKIPKLLFKAFLTNRPVIKLDYNLIKYFIEDDNSVVWSKDVIKGLLKHIEDSEFVIEDIFIEEILIFFKFEFKRLLEVLPKESNQGFGKMLKVILGVFIYSLDKIIDLSYEESKTIIFNYLKLGYYWGISYPLVDDVLDNDILNEEQVNEFTLKLFSSFKGEKCLKSSLLPNCTELLFEYIIKMSELIDENNKEEIFLILYNAHISQIKKFNSKIIMDEFYINMILKASLVRIATAKLSDKEITNSFLSNCFLMAIHNQLEDDFKDFFEDINKSHKTAFTLFYEKKITENPVITLIQYNMFIASKFNDSQKIMKLFAIQFCEIIKYIKNRYGYDNLVYLANVFDDKELKLKEKILEISEYSDSIYYINSEIYLLDYLEENIKKYKIKK